MTRPIENCPQPETPIRERAWTAEQVEAMAKHCDAWEQHDAARMLRAFAATLRQQAEQAGGVVSDEACAMLRRKLPLGCAGMVGNDEARAALEAVAPLLRAPAEQGGRVDVDKLQRVYKAARGLCHGYDWNKGAAARYHRAELLSAVNDIEPVPDAVAKIEAALAQNAQGEAVVEVYRMGNGLGSLVYTDYGAKSDLPHGTKLYLHAERARVLDHHQYDVGWKIRGVSAYNAAKAKGFRHPECVEAAIKAAPSQPEDAGESCHV